jgi:hypothetical protein
MIYFRFSLGSLGKIEIGSRDWLDDPILLKEIVDDVLTSVLKVLESSEELESWVKGIGVVIRLP